MDNERKEKTSRYFDAIANSVEESLSDSEPSPDFPFVECDIGNAPLSRFAVKTRKGEYWSYPYSHVGLIECPSQDRIVIHCNCGLVKTIEIKGRGLRKIAEYLTEARLQIIYETDNPKFVKEETVVVSVTRS